MVKDNFGRTIDYLRISITDRCNLRCIYCMPPEGIETVSQSRILTFEEISRLIKIFVSLGIRKARFTGGEPLLRKGLVLLINKIANIAGMEDLSLTSNGILLAQNVQLLKTAGLRGINVSLDTLRPSRFKMITGYDCLPAVLAGIEKAKQAGFDLKLNVVVMKNINDDEIVDFVKFALDSGLILRFIEFMNVTPLWKKDLFVPIEDVKNMCHKNFNIKKTEYRSWGPAEYYQLGNGMLGFIKTSVYNCRICSRLRLTSTGELKVCLYQPYGISLRDLLRKDMDDNAIYKIIKNLIHIKGDIDYRRWQVKKANTKIYMCSVGG